MSTILWAIIVVLGLTAFFSARLVPHRRVTTLLATTLAFFEVYWLLGVLLAQSFLKDNFLYSLLTVALIMCGAVGLGYLKNKQPLQLHRSGPADMAVLLVLGLVLCGALWVNSANGLRGTDFVLHGFYNGDVVTFASLVQKAIVSAEGAVANPFAGNETLEYPTLLHRGWAAFFSYTTIGLNWLYFWPLLVYVQIIITIPLLFLLWDIIIPPPSGDDLWLGVHRRWLIRLSQILLTIGVITLSWDNYIYPQSHFFLTAAWLLLGAILFSNRSQSLVQIIFGFGIVVMLLLSNAVTGTAAAALFCIYIIATSLERGTTTAFRIGSLAGVALVAGLFIMATPGNAALGGLHFSYTAVADVVALTPWLSLLLAGVVLQFPTFRRESVAILGVISLTFIVFFFSTRDLVVANASRFIYHALLLGLPLTLRPLLRIAEYLHREFWLSSRSVVESGIGVVALGIGVLVVMLPSLGSVASAYDNLLFKDEQHISFQRREALWWLADHTSPSSIIIANPTAPWDVPLFSGRALLRASDTDGAYWLSRDDDTLRQLQAAFTGDRAAQASVLSHGDYLLLTATEQSIWPTSAKEVFATKLYRIYQIK